jgi:hypothetical protein
MATVELTRVVRRAATDEVLIEGTVDGIGARARLWWSHLSGLTPAQRRTSVAQALVAQIPPAETDLGITGSVVV